MGTLSPSNFSVPHTSMKDHNRCIVLSWNNVTVKLKKKTNIQSIANKIFQKNRIKDSEEIKVLDDVNGRAESGSLIAVMGASGSGKTTLLTAISKRMEVGVEGSIYINSELANRHKLINLSGFVSQKDIAISTLTTMEHCYFMSQMKLDHSITSKQRILWIYALFSELGLSGLEHTRLACLSGGERKRLSVAVELLHNPPILFCDEPTTGLDSYNASLLIEKLQNMANGGKMIVCSIHQPASEIFDCFNQLILLSNGKLAYHGKTEGALAYFSSLGHSCPSNYNPADYFIMKLSVSPEDDTSVKSHDYFCQKFSESHLGERLRCRNDKSRLKLPVYRNDFISQSQWIVKLYWLIWRNVIDSMRTKMGHFQQAAVFLITSILLALFYTNISSTTQEGIQDIRGLLYLISSEVYFTSAYRVLSMFPQEIPVYLREKHLYPTSAYYIAKIITMMPRTLIETVAFLAVICIIQYISGSSVMSYFTFIGPLLISACSASAYGCALSAVFQSPNIASVISVPMDLISLLMAGMFFNIRSLPSIIGWLKYFSQLYYTNEVLSVLHWQDVNHIACAKYISWPCLRNGTDVLETYGYSKSNVSEDLAALVLIFFLLNLIGLYGLHRQARKIGLTY